MSLLHNLQSRFAERRPGGFISRDDYGTRPGCRLAVDEFFRLRALSFPLQCVDYTAHWFQKS